MRTGKLSISLADKIYTIILVSIACCAGTIGLFNYQQSRAILTENIGIGLKTVAQTAALGIDAEELDKIKSAGDRSYKHIRDYLLKVKTYNQIKAPLYILKRVGYTKALLLVTTEEGSPIGASYEVNPTLKKTLTTGNSNFSPIYKDTNGTWISAYAPIKDGGNYISGILELNYHVEAFVKQLRDTLLKTIVLCSLGFVIGAFLGIPLLNPTLNRIDVLRIAAEEIEKGNYNYAVTINSKDELGLLAQAFEKMRNGIKDYIEKLKESWLKEKRAHLESVKALSEAIAVREPYTKGHIERVSKYSELIARELALPAGEIEIIKYGCIIHDIGKIGIDINIINKASKLTSAEYEDMKQHPYLGTKIIDGVDFLEKAKDIILYHHERYDGTGYPKGLKGEDIPINARVVALADVYDAMTSDRPYRGKSEAREIVERIKNESGKQFDPKIVDAFLKIKDRLGA
ncbi:MAG: HD domain-containing phosphohydrolase [Candidatus Omnitrophota bacterium]